jgi:hypothetical protein
MLRVQNGKSTRSVTSQRFVLIGSAITETRGVNVFGFLNARRSFFGWNRYSGESDIMFFHVLCSFCLLFGCETWYVTLRQERRLRMFENRMLRNMFGPKRGEVTGEWRRLRNEELNDLYCSPNILMYVPCILLSLLFRPTIAQRIY